MAESTIVHATDECLGREIGLPGQSSVTTVIMVEFHALVAAMPVLRLGTNSCQMTHENVFSDGEWSTLLWRDGGLVKSWECPS